MTFHFAKEVTDVVKIAFKNPKINKIKKINSIPHVAEA